MQQDGFTIYLQWVKAHCGIQGNENADSVAKLGHSNNKSVLFDLCLKEKLVVLKKGHNKDWNDKWKEKVNRTGTGLHLSNLKSIISSNKWTYIKHRRVEVVMNRLRIGHVGVKAYLHRFNMSENYECETCNIAETIEHFLLHCNKYNRQRDKLTAALSAVGIREVSQGVLLGDNNDLPVTKKRRIVSALAEYLIGTGQLDRL